MFYLKMRSNLYHNAHLLAGSENPLPSRNEASLESRAECKKERKERKGKERKGKKPPQNTRTSRIL